MARLGEGLDRFSSSGPPAIRPVPEPRRHEALSVLLTGHARSVGPAVSRFLDYAGQQNLVLEHLWAAYEGDRPIAATLIVPCAGRTGMIFVSPAENRAAELVLAQLVRAACAAQDRSRAALIQALLDPVQVLERKALAAAGFRHLAELMYMQRRCARPTPLEVDGSIQAVNWSTEHRDLFARAILGSYDQTRDCPGLVGLRHIDDIIEGHMATGQFVPELWTALHCGGEPVGVMLLNPVPPRSMIELVYLGLTPSWRGRGIARALLTHALGLARQHGVSDVILAVDRENAPAVQLYRSMRFVPNARKMAMVFALA